MTALEQMRFSRLKVVADGQEHEIDARDLPEQPDLAELHEAVEDRLDLDRGDLDNHVFEQDGDRAVLMPQPIYG